jgi:hypothetical protein
MNFDSFPSIYLTTTFPLRAFPHSHKLPLLHCSQAVSLHSWFVFALLFACLFVNGYLLFNCIYFLETGKISPLTVPNGGVVLSRPRPTLGCSAHDDDDDDVFTFNLSV